MVLFITAPKITAMAKIAPGCVLQDPLPALFARLPLVGDDHRRAYKHAVNGDS